MGWIVLLLAGREQPQSGKSPAIKIKPYQAGFSATRGAAPSDWTQWRGPTADGRLKPNVMAPGEEIISAESDYDITTNNSGALALSGTSMATPNATGVGALVQLPVADDAGVQVYDAATGAPVGPHLDHKLDCAAVSFSPAVRALSTIAWKRPRSSSLRVNVMSRGISAVPVVESLS